MSKKTPKPKSLIDVAAADRAIDDLVGAAEDAGADLAEATRKVAAARTALAEAEAEQQYAAGKAMKLAALTEQAKKIASEQPHDGKIRAAAQACKQAPWAKFQRDGVDDAQLLTVLKTGWPKQDWSTAFDRRGYGVVDVGPAVWLGKDSKYKPTFAGVKLAAEIRRVMGLPQPKPKATPPKPSTKTPDKKPVATKPAKPAKSATPATASRQAAPDPRPSLAKAVKSTKGAGKLAPGVEDVDPGEWIARAAGVVDEIESGRTYTYEELGVGTGQLEEAVSPDLYGTGSITSPVRLSDGMWWAVVMASTRTDVVEYTLQPIDRRKPGSPMETWFTRRGKHESKAPEDVPLQGVTVDDQEGDEWTFGPDADRIRCQVLRSSPAVADEDDAEADEDDDGPPAKSVHVRKIALPLDGKLKSSCVIGVAESLSSPGRVVCDFTIRLGSYAIDWKPMLADPGYETEDDAFAAIAVRIRNRLEEEESGLDSKDEGRLLAVRGAVNTWAKPAEARLAEATSARAEATSSSDPDPRANRFGIYPNVDTIVVPAIGKSHQPAKAEVLVTQGSDGLWRSDFKWSAAIDGDGGMPSVTSTAHPSRQHAVRDAATRMQASIDKARAVHGIGPTQTARLKAMSAAVGLFLQSNQAKVPAAGNGKGDWGHVSGVAPAVAS